MMAFEQRGITDLDAAVEQWAHRKAKKSFGIKKVKNYIFEVKWNRVKFSHTQGEWRREETIPTPPNTMIHDVTFENDMDTEAKQNLKVEKTTKAICKVTMTQGFSVSTDLGLTLELRDAVAPAAIAFGQTITLNQKEMVIEKEQTWSVDTMVKAPPRSLTIAKMYVKEHNFIGEFSSEVTLKGIVRVNIYKRNQNKTFINEIEADIVDVLWNLVARNPERLNIVTSREVPWVLRGSCNFHFGVEQRVSARSEPLIPGRLENTDLPNENVDIEMPVGEVKTYIPYAMCEVLY